MTQGGKKKKRAVNRSIMLAKKIIIKDGGTVRPGGAGGAGGGGCGASWGRRSPGWQRPGRGPRQGRGGAGGPVCPRASGSRGWRRASGPCPGGGLSSAAGFQFQLWCGLLRAPVASFRHPGRVSLRPLPEKHL